MLRSNRSAVNLTRNSSCFREDHNKITAALEEIRTAVDAAEKVPKAPAAPTADTLGGATATGKKLMKAADEKAARDAIGAGTGNSNLALGTTATTAMKGDTAIPTVPAAGTAAEIQAGTATATRVWSPKVIHDEIARQIAAIQPAEG